MTDRQNKLSYARGSIKEAIGKIIGDSDTMNEGAAEKEADVDEEAEDHTDAIDASAKAVRQ